MEIQNNQLVEPRSFDNQVSNTQGFSTQDILWGLGVWTVILGLSPVIMFYVLMVN